MPEPRTEFAAILRTLNEAGVKFVVIGGVAMRLHGSAHDTDDLDVVYSRDRSNLSAVVTGFGNMSPRLRTPDGEVPFIWDVTTLRNTSNLTLRTLIGDVDLLGEAPGVDSFEGLFSRSVLMNLDGERVHVASIDDLIAMKRAAGRVKDQLHLLELQALKKLLEEG